MRNLDPFGGQDPNGFFKLPWDLKVRMVSIVCHTYSTNISKLRILRQLVEWQLSYSTEIKGVIDRGWGVVHMKHKKTNVEVAQEAQQLPDGDPYSKHNLMMVPLGQDAKKKRYWAVDGWSKFIFIAYLHIFASTKTRPRPLGDTLLVISLMWLGFLISMTRNCCA